MKILVVGPSNSPHCVRWINRLLQNGIQVYLLDMAKRSSQSLSENVQVVTLTTLNPLFERINERIRSVKFLAPFIEWIPILFLSRSIKQWIIDQKIELVHIHWLLHPFAVASSLQRSVPVISTPWGSDVLLPHYKSHSILNIARRTYATMMIKLVISKSFFFICDATHLRKTLVNFGAKESQVAEIYFGTDVEIYSPELASKDLIRRYQLEQNEIVILSNRGLDDIYEIWVLLEAIPRVLKELKDVKLCVLIAGGGKDREKLEKISSSLGLDSFVHFLGRLPDKEFAELTASCDLYVSTSPTDGGIAASVAEAMSCEKPVLIANFGDNASWLDNQTAGLLFEPSDPEDFALKMIWLINHRHKWGAMGRIGREIVKERNNSSKEILKVISTYKSCVFKFNEVN